MFQGLLKRMGLQELWARAVNWMRSRRFAGPGDYDAPQVGDNGLLVDEGPGPAPRQEQNNQTPVTAVAVRGKSESLEKIQAGFDRLVDELSGINSHLSKQVSQHDDLIARIDKLPQLLEAFPMGVEAQKALTDQLIGQLKANLLKDQQILGAIEKIPAEAAKQTDSLVNIERQLAASADVDVQMTEGFNRFRETLNKLNRTAEEQTDGISQMSRTFAASDRYLKFIVARQTRQFMWVFYSALGVFVLVVLVLVGIIVYVSR